MRRATILLTLLLTTPAAAAPSGTLDGSFGRSGEAVADRMQGATAITVEPSGHLLVTGGSSTPGVVRLTGRGRRSKAWGRNGIVTAPQVGPVRPLGVRRLADGTVTVASSTLTTDAPPVRILNFGARGERVTSADHPGVIGGPITGGAQRADGGAFVVTPDRENPAGRLSTANVVVLGRDGRRERTLDLCPDARVFFCVIGPVEPRPDGGLIVAVGTLREGAGGTTGFRYELRQVTPAGDPDPAFAPTALPAPPAALHRARDGSVLALMSAYDPQRAIVARVGRSGTLDRRFNRGRGATTLAVPRRRATPVDLTTDARGRIFALLSTYRAERTASGVSRTAIVRLAPDGRQTRRFGVHRAAFVPAATRPEDHDVGATISTDRRGGILVGGARYVEGQTDPVDGCDFREDVCAVAVQLRVWRFRP